MPKRKQCSVAIATTPRSVLKALDLQIGNDLRMGVRDEVFVMLSATHSKRKRYPLVQLLEGAAPNVSKALNDDTAWSREGDAVGRELA